MLVFYHKIASSVNECHNVALKVVDISVHGSVVFNKGRPGLSIVEEVQLFRALCTVLIHCSLGHMGNELAMEGVIIGRGHAALRHLLLGAQTVVVICEVHGHAALRHLLELAARLPGVRPDAVVGQVADGVIVDFDTIVVAQLIPPVGIVVDVGDGLQSSAQRAGGVGVPDLGGDVAAAIIFVYPGGVLMRVVHANQLAKGIVGVGRGQIAALLGDDVAAVVIGVLERNLRLGDLLYQGRGAARSMSARDEGVRGGELARFSAILYGAAGDATEVMLCSNFILPAPANRVFFLRNLLYLIEL